MRHVSIARPKWSANPGAEWRDLAPGQPGYPRLLAEIDSAPPLQVRGDIDDAVEMVAVVGSRGSTPYGEELALELGSGLARAGMVVVSGLALGIDSCAHRGALAAGGRTVAVMGTGRDRIYPWQHRALAGWIARRGALVTQFPIGLQPLRANFPQRNATISGMCLGVVVVEATRHSGAMLTAGSAGDQGRLVMAMPGSVHSPNSTGCHDLIRDGAVLVTSAEEVVREVRRDPLFQLLAVARSSAGTPSPYGDLRDAILDLLQGAPMTLEQLCAHVQPPPREVAAAVGRLRLDGVVTVRRGMYWKLSG